jgi:hypothetical protein
MMAEGKGEHEKHCINCSGAISRISLSFEQKLIKDEDFCRRCWDDIMNGSYDEVAVIPSLA